MRQKGNPMEFSVGDFYNNKIITISADTPMIEARRYIRNFKNSLLAIIDDAPHLNLESSEILGVISTQEILYCDDFSEPVSGHMSAEQKIVDIHSPLIKVVNSMIYEQQPYYLVRNGNYIVGFLGHEELLMSLQKVLQSNETNSTWGLQNFLNPLLPKGGYFSV